MSESRANEVELAEVMIDVETLVAGSIGITDEVLSRFFDTIRCLIL